MTAPENKPTFRDDVLARYRKAQDHRSEAESKIGNWDAESGKCPNIAYWEGQCHAFAAIIRLLN